MKDYFRVIIAGGRDFDDYELLKTTVDKLLATKSKTHNIIIVSGTARGADQLGERYARERDYALSQYAAIWETYGKSAGYIRNQEMADTADALIAFWNGESRGTMHMINIAETKKLLVRVVRY